MSPPATRPSLTFSTRRNLTPSSAYPYPTVVGVVPLVIVSQTSPNLTDVPGGGDGSEASDLLVLFVAAGEAFGEEVVEEGVAQALGGGDNGFGAFDGFVDGVEDVGDGLLLVEGREEKAEGLQNIWLHPLLASGATEAAHTFVNVLRLSQNSEEMARLYLGAGPNDVELGRSETDTIAQVAGERVLAILHTGRDLGEQNVSVFKVGVSPRHLVIFALLLHQNPRACLTHCRHRHKGDQRIVLDIQWRALRIDVRHVLKAHRSPAVGDLRV